MWCGIRESKLGTVLENKLYLFAGGGLARLGVVGERGLASGKWLWGGWFDSLV